MLKDKGNWKTTDINPNSLWIIEKRDNNSFYI